MAEDAAGNMMIVPSHISAATNSDVTPPDYVGEFPETVLVTSSAVSLHVQLNEPGEHNVSPQAVSLSLPLLRTPGEVAWVVVAGQVPAAEHPTASDVAAGNGGPNVVFTAGSAPVAAAATTTAVTQGNLPANTAWTMFMVAVDQASNVQANVAVASFSTLVDDTPPEFTPGSPVVTSVSDSAMVITVSCTEPATVKVLIVTADRPAPTGEQCLAGQDGSGASAFRVAVLGVPIANKAHGTYIANLPHSTAWGVYFCAVDHAVPTPNAMVAPSVVTFSTLPDATPPAFVVAPAVNAGTDSSVSLTLSTHEGSRVYCVVVAQTSPMLTPAQVRLGEDASGNQGVAVGEFTTIS